EYCWIKLQPWLSSCGYMLRPKYHPKWILSWRGTKYFSFSCVDRLENWSDQKNLPLKALSRISILGSFFSSGVLASDPKSHRVPAQQMIEIPTHLYNLVSLMVMPYLRLLDDPPLLTIGEAVGFFRQNADGISLPQGLQFIHKYNIFHRDCNYSDLMMDAKELYPDGFHPRTVMPIHRGDKSVPEYLGERYFEESDPFSVDILRICISLMFISLRTSMIRPSDQP
ncbi:hypothetical protein BU17DRAFT_58334, partial [Hysterangium stoloniferum]